MSPLTHNFDGELTRTHVHKLKLAMHNKLQKNISAGDENPQFISNKRFVCAVRDSVIRLNSMNFPPTEYSGSTLHTKKFQQEKHDK